jgi:hypothetical protein
VSVGTAKSRVLLLIPILTVTPQLPIECGAMDANGAGHGGDGHRLCTKNGYLVPLASSQLLITHGDTAFTLASEANYHHQFATSLRLTMSVALTYQNFPIHY